MLAFEKMLEIYDSTLREGEQTSGVKFTASERIEIAKHLDELGVDYIEVGWPIHKEVMDVFRKLKTKKARLVAFGSTAMHENVEKCKNLIAIAKSNAKYACIFGKTSLEHVKKQLRISEKENLKKIYGSVAFLKKHNIKVFYDAEHYFDAFKQNKSYALSTLLKAAKAGASRLVLCDTNGGSMPHEVLETIKETVLFLKKKKVKTFLGVHFHNDCGLALANALEALPYVKQIQCTVNGIGERVGNTDLCEIVPVLMLKKKITLNINIKKLKKVSDEVYRIANLPRQITQAFVSSRAFMHKGGVHIDATMKGASYEHVNPEDFGMSHELVLTSLGGAACVVAVGKKFEIDIDKERERKKINLLLKELSVIEKKGYDIGNIEAEQFLLIGKYFGKRKKFFSLIDWKIKTEKDNSICFLKGKVNGKIIQIKRNVHGGPVDAAFKAISKMINKKYNTKINIQNYRVRIAKAHGAESTIRTRIDFSSDIEKFSAVGVSNNIITSSIEALCKGFHYYLTKKQEK